MGNQIDRIHSQFGRVCEADGESDTGHLKNYSALLSQKFNLNADTVLTQRQSASNFLFGISPNALKILVVGERLELSTSGL